MNVNPVSRSVALYNESKDATLYIQLAYDKSKEFNTKYHILSVVDNALLIEQTRQNLNGSSRKLTQYIDIDHIIGIILTTPKEES